MSQHCDELAQIRDLYNREAARYDRALEGRFGRWLLRGSRARAAARAHGRLLEIGIGSGASLPFYSGDVQVTGIDISREMLAIARQRLGQAGLEAELHEMDAEHLDFPDASFDSIAFNLVLCTIPEPLQALREAMRVAQPGATMTFLEHVRSNHALVGLPQDLLNLLVRRSIHDRMNLRTEELIRAAGIEVLSIDRWLLGIMTLIVGRAPA